jgi:hypothetical protein
VSDLETTFTPDSAFRVKTITLPGGESRTFTYDHLGHVTRMDIGGYFEEYTRHLHGNLRDVITKGDVVSTRSFDGHDRMISLKRKTDGADEETTVSYFGNGEQKKIITSGPIGGVVFEHEVTAVDALGRVNAEEFRRGSGAPRSYTPRTTASRQRPLVRSMLVTSLRDAAGRFTGSRCRRNQGVALTLVTMGTLKTSPDRGRNVVQYDVSYDEADNRRPYDDDASVFSFTPRVDGLPTEIRMGAANSPEIVRSRSSANRSSEDRCDKNRQRVSSTGQQPWVYTDIRLRLTGI